VHQVVRVARAETLGEHVLDAGRLEHRADASPGDHAGSGRGRAQEHFARAEGADDLVRHRSAASERHLEHALLGGFSRLANRVGDFVGLAEADAHATLLVSHRDDCVEREPPTALHDLGAAIHADHAFDEFGFGRIGATHFETS
jgi:hypothetical protein